jgi:PAS domain S-box-containing protein
MIGSNALFQALDNADSIVIITDVKGYIQYINHAFELNYGYAKSEVMGKSISMLKSGYHENEEYQILWETLLKGNTWRGEFLNLDKSGNYIWDKSTISPVREGKLGQITSFIAIKENITERKKLSDELKRKQRALDQLFYKSLFGIVIMEPLFLNGTLLDFKIISANDMANAIFESDLYPQRLLSNVLSDSFMLEEMVTSLQSEDFMAEWMYPVNKKYLEIRGFYLADNQYCMMVVDVSGYKNALSDLFTLQATVCFPGG